MMGSRWPEVRVIRDGLRIESVVLGEAARSIESVDSHIGADGIPYVTLTLAARLVDSYEPRAVIS